MSIKSFSVNDTVIVEAHPAGVDWPERHLIIRDEWDTVHVRLSEVKELIAQLVEATVYLCSPEDTSSH